MIKFSPDLDIKPASTRKLRRRPNDPAPVPEKRRKTTPDILLNIQCSYYSTIHIFKTLLRYKVLNICFLLIMMTMLTLWIL